MTHPTPATPDRLRLEPNLSCSRQALIGSQPKQFQTGFDWDPTPAIPDRLWLGHKPSCFGQASTGAQPQQFQCSCHDCLHRHSCQYFQYYPTTISIALPLLSPMLLATANTDAILLLNLNFSSTTAQPQQIKFDGLYQMVTEGQEKNASNIKCYGSSSTNHFTPESQLQRNHNK